MREPRVLVFAYHDVGHACLATLFAANANVVGVFTHEDDPREEIWFKSVAALARVHGVPVYTPSGVTGPEWIERIRELAPDLVLSFYYRHMLPEAILALPRLGAFNMHGSLLPKYRGRVPVNWAVLNGETETGATLHHMVRRADAGDIVDQEHVVIGPRETAREVFDKVTGAARAVLERQLHNLLRGTAPRQPQDESRATYFGGRKPDDGRIDWRAGAQAIFNLIRAVTHPYPGAFTDIIDPQDTAHRRRLFVWWGEPVDGKGSPGEVLSESPLRVATGHGAINIVRLQWQGEAEQQATAGKHRLRCGQQLG